MARRRQETWSSRELKIALFLALCGLSYAREFIDGDAYVIEVDNGDGDLGGSKNLKGGWAGLGQGQLNGEPKARHARQFPLQTPGLPLFQPLPSQAFASPGVNHPNVAPFLRQTLRQPGAVPPLQSPELTPSGQEDLAAALLGNPCVTNEGKNGTCTTVKGCYPYFRLFDFGPTETASYGTYDTCAYDTVNGKQVFGICCSEKDIKQDLLDQLEELKNEEPFDLDEFPLDAQINENCGKRPALSNLIRIVNGQEAATNEFPFMVALFMKGRQFCGGSLLDRKHILTAAHCIEHFDEMDLKRMRVYLGDHDLRVRGETIGPEQQSRVSTIIRHKSFKTSTLHNDVAILVLKDAITYSDSVQPICLEEDTSKLFVGETVQVAGWGSISEKGSQSSRLRKVDVKVWRNDECRQSYGSNAPGGITSSMICAASRNKDSCSGDSGGALFKCENDRCSQIGIVSWGIGCARQQYPADPIGYQSQKRFARQLYWPWAQVNPFPSGGSNACFKSSGETGQCVTMKSCFPLLHYKADMPSWMMGERDNCLMTEPSTRQSMAGICCTTRQFGGGGYPFAPQYPPGTGIPLYPGGTYPWSPGQGTQSFGTPGFGTPGIGAGGIYPGIGAAPGIVQPTPGTVPVTAPTHPPTTPTQAPTTPSTTPSPTTPSPVTNAPSLSSPSAGQSVCGVGRHYPVRYTESGDDVESVQRIEGEHPLRVVNGWPADKNEWPWIAALLLRGRQFCGGSLIDSTHILTAAHCVAQLTKTDVQNLSIRLGEHNIRTRGETALFESPAARVVRHVGFSSDTLYDDIAIITMKNAVPVSMNDTIRPVCLPSGQSLYTGQLGTVVGWGSLRENGPQPDVLQELTMKIWDNDQCDKIYKGVSPAGIKSFMMCAGKKGKDSCNGDSGGPFMLGEGNNWVQVGVVSWGIGCGKAEFPGVYTRTTHMRDWIERARNKF
ncbi:hypothetical protein TCAL_01672 [Tigriopus californicus]|uniref:Peptidase S1 domain-containing protein n=1 Tax=Tigriopus californicus TaxID=6832 RepID=A0A553PC32_TIGCA|nr:hypothetical protein TCAL_01672 [Tigriopus californicus]